METMNKQISTLTTINQKNRDKISELQSEVLVDGVNVKDYDLKVLRNTVSMVLQKNVLFSGTLRENMHMEINDIKYHWNQD